MKYLLVNGNSTLRKTHWSVMLTVHNLHSPPLSLSLSPYYCLLRHSLLCFLTVFLHNFCPVHFFISVTVCLCSCVHVSVCSLVCVCVCVVCGVCVCVFYYVLFTLQTSHLKQVQAHLNKYRLKGYTDCDPHTQKRCMSWSFLDPATA